MHGAQAARAEREFRVTLRAASRLFWLYARMQATLEEDWMRHALIGHMDSRRRWAGAAAVALLLAGLWAVALGGGDARGAGTDACVPSCVILIQVDGLEPKDVNPQTTPYLWQLAHPQGQGQNVPSPGLTGRSGWIWQAPRGVMSTGTAPATASLLTGAYPEKSGVPADDFYGPVGSQPFARQRLGAGGFGDSSSSDVASPIAPPSVETLPQVVNANGGTAAIFLGDPTLAGVTDATTEGNPHWFPPGDNATNPNDKQYTGDPRLCPIPRYPDGGNNGTPNQDAYTPSHCPANDMTTMNKAAGDLKATSSSNVNFTFIQLAELGAAKRLAADHVDRPPGAPDQVPSPPSPPQALSDMDAAVGAFVEQYAQAPGSQWSKTVLMVVGSHGYQTTPLVNRVPNPDSPLPTQDLSDYVAGFSDGIPAGCLTLVPQGNVASIYYGVNKDGCDPADRANALSAIKKTLEPNAKVDKACANQNPASNQNPAILPGCIQGVYYTDKNTPDTPDIVPSDWHLDPLRADSTVRTRAAGDLVVVLGRGWAAGRSVAVPYQGGLSDPRPLTNPNTASSGGPQERAVAALINGPSASGLTNAVRNLDSMGSPQLGQSQLKYFPVSSGPADPNDPNNPPKPDNPKCPDTPTDPGGLTCANDPTNVGNGDAGQTGHEAQPVTVDFAKTISALMRLPFSAHTDQLQGRLLQEAFLSKLATPCVSDCEDPPPPLCNDVAELTPSGQPVTVHLSCIDPSGAPLTYSAAGAPAHGTLGAMGDGAVTYTPAADFSGLDSFTYRAASKWGPSETATATIVVMAPPVVVRPPEFDFYGLVRRLTAAVVDSSNRPYSAARRGSVLSTIRLQGEFGRPEAAVTLTFYRMAGGARSSGARSAGVVRLKAIARFDPFPVKRGKVTMQLKIPAQFSPTHIGITVREIVRPHGGGRAARGDLCSRRPTQKPVPFRCTGASGGAIVAIADANYLHKRKGTARGAPRRR
jgi:hypothetical protein